MEIRKAIRKKAKLRLGISAPSGAGKTYGALQLAFGLGGKVGLIDTENGSGDLYANLGDYDIIQVQAPYTVQKYTDAISAFEKAGYSTIIIDSLSHAWAGDGGLLDKQGKIADSSKSGNSYMAWRQVTPDHNALVDAMLQSPCHIIATMRSKTEYVLEDDGNGRKVLKKVGMAPVQRDGMEYEFTVMLDVDVKHNASASKDRTAMFDGQFFKLTTEVGKKLLAWLEDGIDETLEKYKKAAELIANAKDEAELLKLTNSGNYKQLLSALDGRAEKCDLMNIAAKRVEYFMTPATNPPAEAPADTTAATQSTQTAA